MPCSISATVSKYVACPGLNSGDPWEGGGKSIHASRTYYATFTIGNKQVKSSCWP